MKLDPLNIVLDQGLKLNKNFILLVATKKVLSKKSIQKLLKNTEQTKIFPLLTLTLLMTMLMGLVYLKIKN